MIKRKMARTHYPQTNHLPHADQIVCMRNGVIEKNSTEEIVDRHKIKNQIRSINVLDKIYEEIQTPSLQS